MQGNFPINCSNFLASEVSKKRKWKKQRQALLWSLKQNFDRMW